MGATVPNMAANCPRADAFRMRGMNHRSGSRATERQSEMIDWEVLVRERERGREMLTKLRTITYLKHEAEEQV